MLILNKRGNDTIHCNHCCIHIRVAKIGDNKGPHFCDEWCRSQYKQKKEYRHGMKRVAV
jgi:hypothetical protein